LLLTWAVGPLQAVYAGAAGPPTAGASLALEPGGAGTFTVAALAFGPSGTLPGPGATVADLAPAAVRAALYYGLAWGYVESAPDQVAAAVAFVANGTWPAATDHTIAARIVSAAAANTSPSWLVDGTSLLMARQRGRVRIAPVALRSTGGAGAVAGGLVAVTNLSTTRQQVYLPYGVLVGDGSNQALVWATAATPGAGGGPVPVATLAPTATAGAPPTLAPAPTASATATSSPPPTAAAAPTLPAPPAKLPASATATATPAEAAATATSPAQPVVPSPAATKPPPAYLALPPSATATATDAPMAPSPPPLPPPAAPPAAPKPSAGSKNIKVPTSSTGTPSPAAARISSS